MYSHLVKWFFVWCKIQLPNLYIYYIKIGNQFWSHNPCRENWSNQSYGKTCHLVGHFQSVYHCESQGILSYLPIGNIKNTTSIKPSWYKRVNFQGTIQGFLQRSYLTLYIISLNYKHPVYFSPAKYHILARFTVTRSPKDVIHSL